MALTEKVVERARIKAQFYRLTDSPRTVGLSLKITPAGRRIWQFQSTFGNAVQSRRTLGSWPAMSLAEARERAREWHSLVRAGKDPAIIEEQKAEAAAAERRAKALKDATTLAAVLKRYTDEVLVHHRRGKMVASEIGQLINALGAERPIASVTPADIKQVIGPIARRTPYQARNLFGGGSSMFRWGVHADLLETSPTASLSKKLLFAGVKIAPRQRVLTDEELAAFWRAASRLRYPYSAVYKILVLTGCRHSEISNMRWSELHPEIRKALRSTKRPIDWAALPAAAKTLTIPQERFKSGVSHVVPLTDTVLAILETVPRFAGDYLFSVAGGQSAVQQASANKERLDWLMLRSLRALARMRGEDPQAVRLEPFKIRDLRRVVRSHLSALGVEDHVAEMCLGHGRRGIARVYDQHRYEPQIRAALEAWAERLCLITSPQPPAPTGTNVVAMPKKRVS